MPLMVEIVLAVLLVSGTFWLLLPVVFNLVAWLFPVSEKDLAEAAKVKYGNENSDSDEPFINCVITAHEDKEFAFLLIDSLLGQSFKNFHIYGVMDRCEPSGSDPVHDAITLLYPENPLDSKVKAVLTAIDHAEKKRPGKSYTLILDPDNLAHPEMLAAFSREIKRGFQVVQGRRTAKNLSTTFACLDAASDHYYHVTQRLSPARMGSSATIAGSGLVVETGLLKQAFTEIDASAEEGGFIMAEDKQLQNTLVKHGHIVRYAPDALIYDEKVVSATQGRRQRTRWIRSWFQHLNDAQSLIWNGIREGSPNAFYFGLMTSTPPVFILSILAVATALAAFFMVPALQLYLWISAALFVLNVMVSLFVARAQIRVWKSLMATPLFIINQILAMLQLKKAKDDFLTTRHVEKLSIQQAIKETGDFGLTQKGKIT